ncbi:hypothetical protein ACFQ7A_13155 [Streptomyces sp. NPDC056528]|uniref:hypothetical protein n=1 Tax=Streptomyces sp. NPDC056528 TaxID=3345854 RepID=UPI0036761E71
MRPTVFDATPLGPVPAGRALVDRAALALVGAVLEDVHADLRATEADLAASDAGRTAVRPPRLTDGPAAVEQGVGVAY